MPRILVLIILLLPISSKCLEKKSKTLLDVLPQSFTSIYREKKYDKKADKINAEGKKLFIRDGFKYALSIYEKNGMISEIYFTCTQSSHCPSYHELKNISLHTKPVLSKREGGSTGRFLETSIPDKKLILIFNNDRKAMLREIIYKDNLE